MCKIGVPGGSRKDEQSEDGIASVRAWIGNDFAEVRERHAFSVQRVSGAESEARCGTKIRELRFRQAPFFLDRFKAKLEALAFPAGVEPTAFRLGVIGLGKSNFYIVKYR